MTVAPLLHLEGLGRRFGGLTALADVELRVSSGEICGVIGPNGAGKSTLFSLIAGGIPPSTGRVLFQGTDIAGSRPHRVAWRGIARAFQLVNLFDSMTVMENVLIGAEDFRELGLLRALTHGFGYATRHEAALGRTSRALALMEIEPLAAQPVATLTYGQQRLVATARALAAEPALLLLDEPAAGLSEPERAVLGAAVRRARDAGITVLLIEHDINFVMGLCDHVAVLHFGRKIADGSPGDIRENPDVIEAYLGH